MEIISTLRSVYTTAFHFSDVFYVFSYSMEDMYAVVSDVDDYKHFVPWCRDSVILIRKPGHLKAKLAVGFPPVVEKYSSSVTLVPPNLVKVSVSFNSQNRAEFY